MLTSRRHLLLRTLLYALFPLFPLASASAQQTRAVPQATVAAVLAAPLATPPVGGEHADVTIVEYFDYNCPVCRELEPQLRKLLAADPKVRLVRKDWAVFGDGSVYAADASFATAREGRYPAAHEALMTSPKALDTRAEVLAVLEAAGFDPTKIDADVTRHEKEYAEILARNAREATALRLRGTPGLIVDDQLVLSGTTYRTLQRLVAKVRSRS